MSSAPAARPLYIQTAPDPVSAFFHAPDPGEPQQASVLMCSPFGWEDVCSYRPRRDWAQQLAGAGHPVLRFDLPGSGDSAGSAHDPERLGSWTAAVTGAAAWLSAQPDCDFVTAIGVGLGGLLAVLASAEGAAIDDLVLWAVPARGRRLVRELRAFASFEDVSDADDASSPEGFEVIGGFALSADTASALEAVDLTKLSLPGAIRRRVLLLGRDGVAVDARLRKHLAQAGAEVTVSPGEGYRDMMAVPDASRPALAVHETVAAWLKARPAGQRNGGPRAVVPSTSDALLVRTPDGDVRERPFTLEQPAGILFGVLSEPASGPVGEVTGVLLNAGAIRRMGPNGMWVTVARRWAARGVPTLRLDVEGIGDSDGDAYRLSDVQELYVPRLVEQVRAALDELERGGAPARFALGGLCSGSYWAFHAALADARVTSALMLNPRLLFWEQETVAHRQARHLVGQYRRPSTWRRMLAGERTTTRRGDVPRAVAHLVAHALRESVRRAARRPPPSVGNLEIENALDRLRDSDKRLLLAFSGHEPLLSDLERRGVLRGIERWPNLTLATLPGRDHTLRPILAQQEACELLDRSVCLDVERTAAGGSPGPPPSSPSPPAASGPHADPADARPPPGAAATA